MFNASKTIRLFFLNLSVMIVIGIWLTGFETVHWFAWVPPVFLVIGAITGFCPGMIVTGKLLHFFGIRE